MKTSQIGPKKFPPRQKAKPYGSAGRQVGGRVSSRVTGLPPWLDGPNVRYWMGVWGCTYDVASHNIRSQSEKKND